jgi:hypothetical protein
MNKEVTTKVPRHGGKKWLAFIRYALNPDAFEAPEMDEKDWVLLYRFSYRHAILGIVFEGVRRLGEGGNIPHRVLKDWLVNAVKIEKKNVIVNHVAAKMYRQLTGDGLRCCVLKGQGNNLMYPNMFCRTPGDVDVWLTRDVEHQPDVRTVIEYVRNHNPKGKTVYHHIDYGDFEGTDVEAHYRPSFMLYPVHNRRLQKWFKEHAEEQFANRVELPRDAGVIAIPTPEFNAVYQLAHIYSHLLNDGIGLRQIIDYYYVMLSIKDKEGLEDTLRYLGLEKIAGAVMWVLHTMLGMEQRYLIVAMDEQRGRLLAQEMMTGGNFGHKVPLKKSDVVGEKPLWRLQIRKNILRLQRDMRLVRYFPSECLWEPLFRLYHFFWRVAMRNYG